MKSIRKKYKNKIKARTKEDQKRNKETKQI